MGKFLRGMICSCVLGAGALAGYELGPTVAGLVVVDKAASGASQIVKSIRVVNYTDGHPVQYLAGP